MLRHHSIPKPKRNTDIATIGAATRDVFLQSSHFERHANPDAPDGFDACFAMGAKIPIDHLRFETGGGATNAAVTFARFGLKTATVARLGNDVGGHEVRAKLKTEGINVDHLQTDPSETTAYSVILLAGAGQRSILTYRGASSRISGTEIAWKKLSPGWIYLTSIAGNEKLLKSIFTEARKMQVNVAWNPGNAELAMGFHGLLPWLMQSQIVIMNREEAAQLAEIAPRQLDKIIHRLGPLPRQALVVTDGANGAYVFSRGVTWYAPALPGKRVNTTGAGDAFGSGFTAAAIKTGNLETAMRAGMVNSLGVITHMGATAGILPKFPTASQLRAVKIRTL